MPEQAAALVENQGSIDALRDQIQAARDAGASRDDVSDQVAELRVLMEEQRTLIGEVLEANEDLLSGVLEDARDARAELRETGRDRGLRGLRRGPGG